jgi:sugar O-acyltransferase (sialic acid O-acetyltransferase NeuD family)
MKKPLIIYGAGGLGREILSMLRNSEWEVIGFIDDEQQAGSLVSGMKVLGGLSYANDLKENIDMVIGVGDPSSRREITSRITNRRIAYPSLIHPSVIIQSPSVRVGEGSVLCAGSILTTDITIGSHVLVNLKCTIGHDTSIGSYSAVMPDVNIAGNVQIGEAVLLGSGTNILNKVRIGNGATVGMGAVVIRDVADGDTVAGVPAKRIGP